MPKIVVKKLAKAPFLTAEEIRQSIHGLVHGASLGQLSRVRDWILLAPVASRFGLTDVTRDVCSMALLVCKPRNSTELYLDEKCSGIRSLTSYQRESVNNLGLKGTSSVLFESPG